MGPSRARSDDAVLVIDGIHSFPYAASPLFIDAARRLSYSAFAAAIVGASS
jgi:hypothetical protein